MIAFAIVRVPKRPAFYLTAPARFMELIMTGSEAEIVGAASFRLRRLKLVKPQPMWT
jgi:hypothetical protein